MSTAPRERGRGTRIAAPEDMNFRPNVVAFAGGLLGALAVTAIIAGFQAIRFSTFEINGWIGAIITGRPGVFAWLLGMAVHLALGALIGLLYGGLFRVIGGSGWVAGGAFGLTQWLFAGVALGAIPAVPGAPAPSGYFGLNYGGMTFVEIMLFNFAYGAIVGEVYRRALVRAGRKRPEEESTAGSPLADSLGQGFIDFEGYKLL